MNGIVGLKNKAITLRREGKSYNGINDILGIPKSTLSTWLKDLPLSKQVKFTNISKAKKVWAKNIKEKGILTACQTVRYIFTLMIRI